MNTYGMNGNNYPTPEGNSFCSIAEVLDGLPSNLGTGWIDITGLKTPEANPKIQSRIGQATNWIISKLALMGYLPTDIKSGTDTAPIIRDICNYYAKYLCIRDAYRMSSPSNSPGEPLTKYKDDAVQLLEDIYNNKMAVVNIDGSFTSKNGTDVQSNIMCNTLETKRIFSMDNVSNEDIDIDSYANQSVVGAI